MEEQHDTYAMVNDSGHDFGNLHYHVYREHQIEQLAQCGFETLCCFGDTGNELPPDTENDGDLAGHSVAYVARRL
jgi:hypothetical protein